MEVGDFDKAIADLSKAIELDPEDASAYVNRARARELNGDSEGAAADYARAKALYGDSGDQVYYDEHGRLFGPDAAPP